MFKATENLVGAEGHAGGLCLVVEMDNGALNLERKSATLCVSEER